MIGLLIFKVLTWLNPSRNVRVEGDGQLFPAISIKIAIIDTIHGVYI